MPRGRKITPRPPRSASGNAKVPDSTASNSANAGSGANNPPAWLPLAEEYLSANGVLPEAMLDSVIAQSPDVRDFLADYPNVQALIERQQIADGDIPPPDYDAPADQSDAVTSVDDSMPDVPANTADIADNLPADFDAVMERYGFYPEQLQEMEANGTLMLNYDAAKAWGIEQDAKAAKAEAVAQQRAAQSRAQKAEQAQAQAQNAGQPTPEQAAASVAEVQGNAATQSPLPAIESSVAPPANVPRLDAFQQKLDLLAALRGDAAPAPQAPSPSPLQNLRDVDPQGRTITVTPDYSAVSPAEREAALLSNADIARFLDTNKQLAEQGFASGPLPQPLPPEAITRFEVGATPGPRQVNLGGSGGSPPGPPGPPNPPRGNRVSMLRQLARYTPESMRAGVTNTGKIVGGALDRGFRYGIPAAAIGIGGPIALDRLLGLYKYMTAGKDEDQKQGDVRRFTTDIDLPGLEGGLTPGFRDAARTPQEIYRSMAPRGSK